MFFVEGEVGSDGGNGHRGSLSRLLVFSPIIALAKPFENSDLAVTMIQGAPPGGRDKMLLGQQGVCEVWVGGSSRYQGGARAIVLPSVGKLAMVAPFSSFICHVPVRIVCAPRFAATTSLFVMSNVTVVYST